MKIFFLLLLSFNINAAILDTNVPLTAGDITDGVTIQGTVNYSGSNNQHGIVFGYGDCTYGQPNLMLKSVWAVIRVCFGNSILYFEPRWNKGVDIDVKLFVPSDVLSGGELQLFLNDELQTPSGYLRTVAEGNSGAINPNIFGGAFSVNTITNETGDVFNVSNVSMYTPTSESEGETQTEGERINAINDQLALIGVTGNNPLSQEIIAGLLTKCGIVYNSAFYYPQLFVIENAADLACLISKKPELDADGIELTNKLNSKQLNKNSMFAHDCELESGYTKILCESRK